MAEQVTVVSDDGTQQLVVSAKAYRLIYRRHGFRLAGDEPAVTPTGPTGSVREILASVGDDPALARAALEAEQARGAEARKTLVAELEKRVR